MRPHPFPLLFCSGMLLAGCLGAAAPPDPDPNRAVREALQAELEDFTVPGWNRCSGDWAAPADRGLFLPPAGPALTAYRQRLTAVAGWTGGPVWHQAGTLPRPGRPGEKLGINVFLPPGKPKGTLLFVHGFLSHGANFAYTTAWFTAKGWAVTTLDLPGHGLSTGPRGEIGEFSEYGDAVQSWMAWVWAQGWAGPKVLAAHSLGTAACLEALGRTATPRPDRVVFCAPLLRPLGYPWVALGASAAGAFFRTVPTVFGWDGYLDGYFMPMSWFSALDRWLRTLENRRPLDQPLTVYAGDRDEVVDTGWNLAEYRRLVPRVKEVVLPGRNHLFLSNPEDREAFHRVLGNLADGALTPPPPRG